MMNVDNRYFNELSQMIDTKNTNYVFLTDLTQINIEKIHQKFNQQNRHFSECQTKFEKEQSKNENWKPIRIK